MQPATTRAAINRANSQHSTGPRTIPGKQRASLNALRHGLTAHTIVLPSEDPAAYQRHTQGYFDEYAPNGPTETQLVQTIADTAWRMNRISVLETNVLTMGMLNNATGQPTTDPAATAALATAASIAEQSRALATLSLHEQRLSRQFHRALAELRQLQAARQEREIHKQKELTSYATDDGFVFSKEPNRVLPALEQPGINPFGLTHLEN